MALPVTGGRSAAVVSVEFDPDGSPGVFTNWCGAKNLSITIDNEIQTEKVGDCSDWSAPVVTVKEFSGQNITASMDATWTADQHAQTSDWALSQLRRNIRITFPNATVGQVSSYEGAGMLQNLQLGEIGNVDGNKISETIAIEIDGTLTRTLAT